MNTLRERCRAAKRILSREVGSSSEHALMFAVIGQALDDIYTTTSADGPHRESAILFFTSGGFTYYAQMAGINSEYVSRVIKKARLISGSS